ncbi:hypothetical protein QUW39_03405 [Lactobacillus crispatus]|uniref:Uncharacterized protein n=1 Tax=Lactobacillus crispatus TaxID=47770 RepID=A0A7X4HMP4_9LACO|nr:MULTISPECIES: hypothetical protein [Lactobacillus]PEG99529.1 hypothetical protein CP359_01260 [Lactobacillus sp. UMNPBX8]MDK6666212.1 hypothetical protein [Lactobacillus crispatus]MDK8611285.1 hypothetical protein [Lactobacillus crispatus]MDM8290359.1 hypothetical protein [Lactobacillus crispatus]MDT9609500.1 hypothetical protein [Lactobacillus crispatus]
MVKYECIEKASRFKGGRLVTCYLIKDRPQPAKVNWTVFYYAQNVKIKISKAIMKVANANISMSAW